MTTDTSTAPVSGPDIMRQFIPASPFAKQLGLRLLSVGDGRAELLLPFSEAVVTIGDTVHGGAIATLLDTAAMAASWATDQLPSTMRGSTVSLTVDYISAARSTDVRAVATVQRPGRTLVFLRVEAFASDGKPVAQGSAIYRLG